MILQDAVETVNSTLKWYTSYMLPHPLSTAMVQKYLWDKLEESCINNGHEHYLVYVSVQKRFLRRSIFHIEVRVSGTVHKVSLKLIKG